MGRHRTGRLTSYALLGVCTRRLCRLLFVLAQELVQRSGEGGCKGMAAAVQEVKWVKWACSQIMAGAGPSRRCIWRRGGPRSGSQTCGLGRLLCWRLHGAAVSLHSHIG